MIKYLKKGPTQQEKSESNKKVQIIVEDIIGAIEKNGDEAVRKYSETFDKWTPKSCRLSKEDITACYDELSEQVISDIR